MHHQQTVREITWHYEIKSTNGVLRHPCDGEAWKHFDRVYFDFSIETRHMWLDLFYDGFNSYVQASNAPYSCLVNNCDQHNLFLEMYMSKSYMFLSCLIPLPLNPKFDIVVF